ncbi:MAG: hypothetical protein N3F66_04125 [Spirochaetes bacterium]|nr:hypothetical protein [Spirochaetota bacterium]
MNITAYILQHTTAALIIAGILIAVAGLILRKFRILSIVMIIIASMIIYVLLYKTFPIPGINPEAQESQSVEKR